jgi:hypothetical protein
MDNSVREYLKDNIYDLSLFYIIDNYVLDEDFIVRYILNPNYQLTEDEEKIDLQYLINNENLNKYLNMEDIQEGYDIIYKNKSFKNYKLKKINRDSDLDSIDDFEYVSNK